MASNYQLFVAGNVLTASQVNTNLQRQTIVQCDAAADRTALPSVEGLVAYQKDTDELWVQVVAGAWTQFARCAAWETFTPTVTGWSIGNGTASGRYTKQGRTVTCEMRVTAGSTTTFGAALTLTLPFTAATAASDGWTGTAFFFDQSTGFYYPGVAPVASAGTTTLPRASGTNGVSASSPFAWTTSDVVQIALTYEASA